MTEVISECQENRCKQFTEKLLNKINLFNEREDLSVVDQLLATKIFICSLSIFLLIITVFAAVSIQVQNKTVDLPSEAVFDYLSLNYRSTLSCPCQQTSMAHKNFISFNPQYHPICTSQLINQTFISLFLSDQNMSEYWPLDYRVMMASHFQMLTLFCQNIQQAVSDNLDEFANRQIISTQVIFRDIFEVQMSAVVQKLKQNIFSTYAHARMLLSSSMSGNRIQSALRTNAMIQANPIYITSLNITSTFYGNSSTFCSCSGSQICTHNAGIYNWTGRNEVSIFTIFGDFDTDPPLLFSIPGIFVGCLPYNSLIKSTLECFFNQQCIDMLQTFIKGLSIITPLSSSHFSSYATVSDLLEELLIESWNEQSNFTNYYQICSPLTCTYTYNRRFYLIYVILTLISVFGGLKTVTYFAAPLISKSLRYIQKTKCFSKTTTQSASNNKTLKERCVEFINRIYQQIRNLNLFPMLSDVSNGIYSTRFYILFLTIGIIILTFYLSFATRTRTVTLSKPSIDQYEELFTQYSSTLICPCRQLSISYSTIVTIHPYYHEICTSNFSAKFMTAYRLQTTYIYFSFDFRLQYTQWFTLLDLLCMMTPNLVTNQLTAFNDTQFVSGQVLAKDIFRSEMHILIEQFQNETQASFAELFQVIRNSIQLNQFYALGSSNAQFTPIGVYNTVLWRFYATNIYDNQCSCGTNSSCIRSQGFYCRTVGCNLSTAKPNQTVPGLFVSCLPIDSLLSSTLECFYNASCIQMLFEWRTFSIPNTTISSSADHVIPLTSSVNSRFPPNITVDKIVTQLFIENWTNLISFKDYYNQCDPIECTYTFEERINIVYLITTILGIVGGLSVALRIITPFVVTFVRKIYQCQHSDRRQTLIERLNYVHRIRQFNFYHKTLNNQPIDIHLIRRQQIATRFYMIIFFIAMIIVLTFTSVSTQIYSITVSSPSESTFEFLKYQYPSTISCPCSQISIPYSTFLSVNVSTYHQVCSSYFISSDFIKLTWGQETAANYFWYLDIKILSAQFRVLSSLCELSKAAVNQKMNILYSQKLVTTDALSQSLFQIQVDSLINDFIRQTPLDFRRTLYYIVDMLHASQLQSMFYLNWNITQSNSDNNYIMSTYPIVHNESGEMCSCATSSTCTRSILHTRYINKTIKGIVFGCLPMYGLRFSSLACFYNATCLEELANFIGSTSIFQPLNYSVETRFNSNLSIAIDTLIAELFIETWTNSSNYSSYYSTCAPFTCEYSYTKRNNALYIITTILGLYGGLTVGLKSVIWYILSIYWKICQFFKNRQQRIEPIAEIIS